MKKWFKNWWFSIAMFLFAIGLTIYIIISSAIEDYDDFILTLLLISAFTPVLIFLLLGLTNIPRKEKENESNINKR